MIIPILKYGAPELRKVSEPVISFDDDLKELVANMMDTMYSASGVGLAAPQVGVNIRLITIDTSGGEEKGKAITVCNPEIIASEGAQTGEEGCLSVPTFCENVKRPMKLDIKGLDINGNEIAYQTEGILARVFSHEIDHLNGVLFVDHLSALKRNLIRNKIKKLVKNGEW
ncbi:MAG: peptide deformylase [Acidobacteriota bacterium]|jgi:peptide deformylase